MVVASLSRGLRKKPEIKRQTQGKFSPSHSTRNSPNRSAGLGWSFQDLDAARQGKSRGLDEAFGREEHYAPRAAPRTSLASSRRDERDSTTK